MDLANMYMTWLSASLLEIRTRITRASKWIEGRVKPATTTKEEEEDEEYESKTTLCLLRRMLEWHW